MSLESKLNQGLRVMVKTKNLTSIRPVYAQI